VNRSGGLAAKKIIGEMSKLFFTCYLEYISENKPINKP